MSELLRPSGVGVIGDMRWGTHFCHFYETPSDLLSVLVPFFKTGLEGGELCLWILCDLDEQTALSALRAVLPDTDRYRADGALVIVPYDAWYFTDGRFDRALAIRRAREAVALAASGKYLGLRANGIGSWLTDADEAPQGGPLALTDAREVPQGGPLAATGRPRGQRSTHREFARYEAELGDVLRGKRVIAACAFRIGESRAADILDVARAHEFVVARRHGEWQLLESPELTRARDALVRLNEQLESRVRDRTRELSTQKEILQQIIEHIPAMIGFYDVAGRLTYANPQWERTRGWTVRELLADSRSIMDQIYPDPVDNLRARKHLAAATGEWMDFRTRTKDGRVIDTQVAIVGLSDGTRIAIGQDISARKRFEEQLETTSEQLRAMAASASSAREQEGLRIARELHDELGSTLTGLKWDLESLRDSVGTPAGSDTGQVAERLTSAIRLTESTIASVRRLASELRPAILDDLGLAEAIEWQAEQFQARSGIECRLHVEGTPVTLSPDRATAVFRIFQEALTNVLRHAQATRVDVRVSYDTDQFRLSVRDNGKGISEDARSHRQSLGLAGMHERARSIGGTLDISGRAGEGTLVMLEVPW